MAEFYSARGEPKSRRFRGLLLHRRSHKDYLTEPLGIVLDASSPWNFGFNYRPFSWIDLSLAFERGNSLMSRLSLLANLNDPGLPKFDPPSTTDQSAQ